MGTCHIPADSFISFVLGAMMMFALLIILDGIQIELGIGKKEDDRL